MIDLGHRFARLADEYPHAGHPLEVTRDLAQSLPTLSAEVAGSASLAEVPPVLAQLVAASPIEAAIHDGYGKALSANAYNVL
jgi:hypothetical protein